MSFSSVTRSLSIGIKHTPLIQSPLTRGLLPTSNVTLIPSTNQRNFFSQTSIEVISVVNTPGLSDIMATNCLGVGLHLSGQGSEKNNGWKTLAGTVATFVGIKYAIFAREEYKTNPTSRMIRGEFIQVLPYVVYKNTRADKDSQKSNISK